jgi:hypothetical protein
LHLVRGAEQNLRRIRPREQRRGAEQHGKGVRGQPPQLASRHLADLASKSSPALPYAGGHSAPGELDPVQRHRAEAGPALATIGVDR